MTKTAEELLAMHIGGATVAEHLQKAIAAGALIEHEDGSLELPPAVKTIDTSVYHNPVRPMDCIFLMKFLFNIAYGEAAVPFGCRECYKVTVSPANLRGLMALRAIQESIACNAKCTVDVDRPITQNVYIGFFYCVTLDHAREVYQVVRAAVDAEPKLGPQTPVRIKRGCTEYEIHCGPSDQYTFDERLPELEQYLRSRFRRPSRPKADALKNRLNTLSNWIQTAYRIGDNSYLDFTGGKPLYPKSVTYDPKPADPKPE